MNLIAIVTKLVVVMNFLVMIRGAFHKITFVMAEKIAKMARMRAIKFVPDVRKINFAVIMECVSLRIKDATEAKIARILPMKKTALERIVQLMNFHVTMDIVYR